MRRQPQRHPRRHEPADLPENYEETIVSLTANPMCPECAAGKHAVCAREALDPETDEIVSCQCPTCEHGGDRDA